MKTIKLKINKPMNIDWHTFGEIVRDIDCIAHKAMTRYGTEYYLLHQQLHILKEANPQSKVRELRNQITGGIPERTYLGHQVKNFFKGSGVNSGVVANTSESGIAQIKRAYSDAIRGTSNMPTFNQGTPFVLPVNNIRQHSPTQFELRILNKEGGEKYGVERVGKTNPIHVEVKRGKSFANNILKNLLDGTYRLAESKMQVKGKDVYLLLAYESPKTERVLDSTRIVGVDLGISKAVYMATNFGNRSDYIDGGEIESFRERTEKRRVSLRNQLRVASENRHGHGKKTLLKPLDTISNKISNFRDTVNHRYSKYVVDYAIKNNCGTIQLEDLTGVSQKSKFLKNWSYYDLQTKIEYKAKAQGIDVVKIKPHYTSQRCNKCGCIDSDNRLDQETFECTTCGHKDNADRNAAKNIATKDIDLIIEEQLKSQKVRG